MNWSDYRDKILRTMDYEAFYLNELENIQRRGTELKASCPFTEFHERGYDRNPSLTVNLDKGVFYCQTCHTKGNAHRFLSLRYKLSNEEAWYKMGDALSIERPTSTTPDRPPINPGLITQYQKNLKELVGPIPRVLSEKRGLTEETIDRFQLGWDKECITIPILDEWNEVVNFRRYKWNAATSADKMKNYVDGFGNAYGEVRIFGIENFFNESIDDLVWCEGELDRIILEQMNIPSATPTSGAGSFRDEWIKYFRAKKRIYIVMDNDEAGRKAALSLAEKLYRITPVFIVEWPSDFVEKGDPTDFFVGCSKSREDFLQLLSNAKQYKVQIVEGKLGELTDVHLAAAAAHELIGQRQRIQVMCSGKDTAPYVAPHKIRITCSVGNDPKCGFCGNAQYGGEQLLVFDAKKAETISLIQCSTSQQTQVIKETAMLNTKCRTYNMEILEHMNVEEIRVIPQAESNHDFAKENEYVVRKCYYLGKDLKTNQRYTMTGYSHAEPRTQYVTHIFDDAVPTKDRIASFEMTDELNEALSVFKVSKNQTVRQKFEEIHKDLERNITYVWDRRKVGMVVDLVYHTALSFYFQEQFVRRGWAEALIIGDSGQAKSTLVERLMRHYQLGEFYSGESSRRTGLVYSFQQTQKRWFLIWGAWPLNDGGLVVIDEFSGIGEDEIATMSDVRSSGVARATGVITAETNARTRAIFIGNPRNGRPIDTETHGIQAVLKLFGKAEDVRRLDVAIAVASGDVQTELINRAIAEVPRVKHMYTSDLCKQRVLWCWSRKPEDIIFTDKAVKAILANATAMGKKYNSRVPIVEPADQRLKLARLSIAAAGCVYSTEDGHKLLVTEDHVNFVYDLLNEIYDDKNLGYNMFSEIANRDLIMPDEFMVQLRKKFALLPVVDINELAQILYEMQYFRRSELQDSTGLGTEDLLRVLSFLNVNKIIERTMSGYRKLPNGIKFLKSILDKPIGVDERRTVRNSTYANEEF